MARLFSERQRRLSIGDDDVLWDFFFFFSGKHFWGDETDEVHTTSDNGYLLFIDLGIVNCLCVWETNFFSFFRGKKKFPLHGCLTLSSTQSMSQYIYPFPLLITYKFQHARLLGDSPSVMKVFKNSLEGTSSPGSFSLPRHFFFSLFYVVELANGVRLPVRAKFPLCLLTHFPNQLWTPLVWTFFFVWRLGASLELSG